MIASWLETNPVGRVFLSPLDVVLSDIDIVVPDLIYVSNARAAALLTELHVRGMPELLVEVASPDTRKRDDGIKRRLYERIGVTEYWIVDPEVDRICVYTRDGSDLIGERNCRASTGTSHHPSDAGTGNATRPNLPRTVSFAVPSFHKVPSSASGLFRFEGSQFSIRRSGTLNLESRTRNDGTLNSELGTQLGTRNSELL